MQSDSARVARRRRRRRDSLEGSRGPGQTVRGAEVERAAMFFRILFDSFARRRKPQDVAIGALAVASAVLDARARDRHRPGRPRPPGPDDLRGQHHRSSADVADVVPSIAGVAASGAPRAADAPGRLRRALDRDLLEEQSDGDRSGAFESTSGRDRIPSRPKAWISGGIAAQDRRVFATSVAELTRPGSSSRRALAGGRPESKPRSEPASRRPGAGRSGPTFR